MRKRDQLISSTGGCETGAQLLLKKRTMASVMRINPDDRVGGLLLLRAKHH